MFQEFVIQEESVTFRINLTILLDCLSIFGSSPTPGELFYYYNYCYYYCCGIKVFIMVKKIENTYRKVSRI